MSKAESREKKGGRREKGGKKNGKKKGARREGERLGHWTACYNMTTI